MQNKKELNLIYRLKTLQKGLKKEEEKRRSLGHTLTISDISQKDLRNIKFTQTNLFREFAI